MKDQERLEQLINKGKKTQLNNKELVEMIQLIGPDQAMKAIQRKD